jgi:hypothetical protein
MHQAEWQCFDEVWVELLHESRQLLLHFGENGSQGSAAILGGPQRRFRAVQLDIIAGQRCVLGRSRVTGSSLFRLGELRRETFAIGSRGVEIALHCLFGVGYE